jgi:hypothetical protein
MSRRNNGTRFVVCVKNTRYGASLELRKIYEIVPDKQAAARHFVRIVDESGEDYLYPESYFLPIELPKKTEKLLRLAS